MILSNRKVERLVFQYKEISLLGKIGGVLGWDLNVNLPPKASEGRAAQSAYLTKLVTEKWLDPDFRANLESIDIKDKKLTEDERAIVRNLQYAGKYYYRVPKEVIIEFSETASKAFVAWSKAKKDNKFSDFKQHLAKMVKLNQTIAQYLEYKDNPYDALLDLHEPELTAATCRELFVKLQPELTKLLAKIVGSRNYIKDSNLIGEGFNYPIDLQKQLSVFVLRRMNYDFDAGRLDVSSHPFTDTMDRYDVRITSRYKTTDFRESLMSAMHEGGHALYEQGVNDEFSSTPLEGGISLGIHESQSRFWENQIGRSLPFMAFMAPVFHAFFPDHLAKAGEEGFFKLFNTVKPSFIRTESDEVTYNLHIILRFEIENGLINGKIKVDDLPEVWREKMKEYLGVVPATDREGVLQDVHWSHGMMGYFPTYTLGNLYAAQFTNVLKKEIDLEEAVRSGNFGTVLSWLRENIHKYGSLYMPEQLAERVTGEKINTKYFLDYLKIKYKSIYSFS